jgi:hypothetical protein
MPRSHLTTILDVLHMSRKIIFLMQLLSCRNSSEINGNHRNNILTVATGNDDVIMPVATVVHCYAIAGLVPLRCPKMELTKLKTKA